MPPIQQQQTSRAGLITALVLSIMAAIGLGVWAVMLNGDRAKAIADKTTELARFKEIISDEEMADDSLKTLNNFFPGTGAASADSATTSQSLIYRANAKYRALSKVVSGREDATPAEVAAELKTLKDKVTAAKVSVVEARADKFVDGLILRIKGLEGDVAKAKSEALAANDKADKADKAVEDAVAKWKADLETEQKKYSTLSTSSATDVANVTKAADGFKESLSKVHEDHKGELEKDEKARKGVEDQLAATKKDLDKAVEKIAQARPSVKNAMMRNVDAIVTQLSADNTCYINLTFGDHIMPGMTFEVYGKEDGIPKLEDGTSTFNMPKGKGTIEVLDVGQNSTRCRLILQRPGQTVTQGDLCANLIYDKNVKPVFFVFGEFDMDHNGVATRVEGEVIKNLVARWGGMVSEELTVQVDYVIVGKEPVLPTYTKEELEQDAAKRAKYEKAKAELDAFNAAVFKAATLHIPVLNQNRFLYYCGYFESSKR